MPPPGILPFDRDRLGQRNAFDDAEAREDAARRTPSDRVLLSLELSQLVRDLARAAGTLEPADADADLAEKARIWVAPLRLLAGRR